MRKNEKLYHIGNLAAIPMGALAAGMLVLMGKMADKGQISMSDPGMSLASLLLFIALGLSGIWVAVSGFIHVNLRAVERKNEQRNLKSFAWIIIFFIILAVSVLFTPLWMLGIAVFAIYLFVISVRTLILARSSENGNR